MPTEESTSPALAKEDIPAADADVKDTEAPAVQKKVETTEKAPEVRKDPREDPVGWINSLIPGAAHKVPLVILLLLVSKNIQNANSYLPPFLVLTFTYKQ